MKKFNAYFLDWLVRQLVEEGADGRTLWHSKKDDLYVVFSSNGRAQPTIVWKEDGSEDFWRPSFLPADIWEDALDIACSWRQHKSLPAIIFFSRYILRNRLPEDMKTELFLRATDGVDFVAMLRPYFKPGMTMRLVDGTLFYFDDDLIYRSRPYSGPWFDAAADFKNIPCASNAELRRSATHFWQEGMTLDECLLAYLAPSTRQPNELRQFVTKIFRPILEREPGNKDRATFDRVRVTVSLNSRLFSDQRAYLDASKRHKKAIARMVLDTIAQDKRFVKLGVPVNFLKLTSVNIWRDHTLEYIFELKDISA